MDESARTQRDQSLQLEVARAKAGDRNALESVVRAVRQDVYV
jgi:hypothetical protein